MKYVLCIVLLVLSSLSFSAESLDLAIRNVTVIDAASEPRPHQTVYVTGSEIALIASADEFHPASTSVDGTGKFLIPGLWDMHVHIVYEDALIEAMPGLFLDYGITSVRDTGALLAKIAPQVKRWRSMGANAPDLFFAGPLQDGSLVVYDGDGRTEIGVSNTDVEAALASFAKLQAAGADLIKIYELVSPEVFQALASAAEEAGMPIAAHVPLSMKASVAGPKVGSMEHLRNVEIECADDADALYQLRQNAIANPEGKSGYELRSYLHSSQRTVALQTADPTSPRCQKVIESLVNTIQVPTLRLNTITQYSPLKRDDWRDNLNRMPDVVAKKWYETAQFYAGQTSQLGEQMSAWSLSLVGAMNQAGVPIGAGTDTPIGQAIPGYSLHTELERLVEAGLSPRQALASATIRPAEFFGLENKMGRIQASMEADLILLKQNPLDDIRHTRQIELVVSDGILVR